MSAEDSRTLQDAIRSRDLRAAWDAWSFAAEGALIDDFCASDCPISVKWFVMESCTARFKNACIGGPKMRKTMSNKIDAGDAVSVDLYRCSSTATLLDLHRRLRMLGKLGKLQKGFVKKKSMTAGEFEWMRAGGILSPFLCLGVMVLLIFCVQWRKRRRWHQGLLDAYIAMILKVDGEAGVPTSILLMVLCCVLDGCVDGAFNGR